MLSAANRSRVLFVACALSMCLFLPHLHVAQAQVLDERGDLRLDDFQINVPEQAAETREVNPNEALEALLSNLAGAAAATEEGANPNAITAPQRINLLNAAATPQIPAPILLIRNTMNSGLRR